MNMKKIYMSPEMDVMELNHQQTLLAGSVFDVVSDQTINAEDVDTPQFSDVDLDIFAE